MNRKYIHGASCGLVLEGIGKKIFLFGDIHENELNRCRYNSESIMNYFDNIIYNTPIDKKIDAFIEITDNLLVNTNISNGMINNYNNNDIFTIGDDKISSFIEYYKILVKNDSNLIGPKIFARTDDKDKNVRFHIGDIRDYLNPKNNLLLYDLWDSYNIIKSKDFDSDVLINKFSETLNTMYDINSAILNGLKGSFLQNETNNILLEIYDFKKKHSKIDFIIKNDVCIVIGECINVIVNIIKTLTEIYIVDVNLDDKIRKVQEYILYIFQKLNDIYMIRRIVSSSDLNNIFMYYGLTHIVFIASILIVFFNMKITAIASKKIEPCINIDPNSNDCINITQKTIDTILNTNYRSNRKNYDYFKIYRYLTNILEGNDKHQCLDITNFPTF